MCASLNILFTYSHLCKHNKVFQVIQSLIEVCFPGELKGSKEVN